jgi:hypothetical protein
MKFIKGFGITSKPLTELLKKRSFSWNDTAQKAFEDLEVALCKALILALSDFAKDIIVIGATSDSKKKLISVAHDSYIRSHVGIQNSYRRLKTLLYWPFMKKMVKQIVNGCDICKQAKLERIIIYPGLLQPPPVPNGV